MPEKEMDLLSKVMLQIHEEWTEGKLDSESETPGTEKTENPNTETDTKPDVN